MKLRFPLVLLAALAAFAIPAGSAFAITGATFVAPVAGATISQNQTFTVDASGVAGATQVYFSIDDGAGHPSQHVGDGVETAPGSGVYTWQAPIGGWANPNDPSGTDFTTPYPLTIDAVVADGSLNTLDMASVNVTVDNTIAPLTITSVAPAADSTVSGTFNLSVTPSDPNNTVTAGHYTIEGGDTGTLVSDGNGNFTASIDTAAGVPNGDLYLDISLEDAPGNTTDTTLHLVVGNPQAPVITPGTLVADKSLYRTDETQLEVGDIVEAYNMEASGYPDPTYTYVWHFCPADGSACTDVPGGDHGSYTIQAGDVGTTLTLIATATNASGSDSTSVGFGVIAPAYVAPVDEGGGYGDAPVSDPTPAPVDTTPAPPVAPPVVTPPAVKSPAVVTAEQQVAGATQAVSVTAERVVVVARKLDVARRKMVAAEKAVTAKKAAVAKLVAAKKDRVAEHKSTAALDTKIAAAKEKVAASSKTVVAAKKNVAADAKTVAAAKKKAAAAKKQLAAAQQALAASHG